MLIGEERKGKMKPLGGFALIRGVLCGEAEEVGDAQRFEFCKMVAEGTALRGASAGAGDKVPAIGIGHARFSGAG